MAIRRTTRAATTTRASTTRASTTRARPTAAAAAPPSTEASTSAAAAAPVAAAPTSVPTTAAETAGQQRQQSEGQQSAASDSGDISDQDDSLVVVYDGLTAVADAPSARRSRRSRSAGLPAKDEGYFYVERVTSMRPGKDGVREFEVHWEGYDLNDPEALSWEPEPHLDGCVEKLKQFLEPLGLTTTLEPRVGASPQDSADLYNRDIWPKLQTIVAKIESKRGQTKSRIPVKAFDFSDPASELLDGDAIYVCHHSGHCFVVLHHRSKRIAIYADGRNNSASAELRKEFEQVFGEGITDIEFVGQTKLDHCGSSGVIIALKMMCIYESSDGDLPDVIYARPKQHRLLKNELYKGPSLATSLPDHNILLRPHLSCPCGFGTNKTKMSALRMHKISCKLSKIN